MQIELKCSKYIIHWQYLFLDINFMNIFRLNFRYQLFDYSVNFGYSNNYFLK